MADLLLRLQFLGKTWVFTRRGIYISMRNKKGCLDHIVHILCTVCFPLGITKVILAGCFKIYISKSAEKGTGYGSVSERILHRREVIKNPILCQYYTKEVHEDINLQGQSQAFHRIKICRIRSEV